MMKSVLLLLLLICILLSLCIRIGKTTSVPNQMTAHHARVFLLHCMDFRLIDDVDRWMAQLGYTNDYDDFILAGASLGYNQTEYPVWKQVYETHLELARRLHHIEEVAIIDHMNCGAYRLFYHRDDLSEKEERELHLQNLDETARKVQEKYPDLRVSTFLMQLDGTAERIQHYPSA